MRRCFTVQAKLAQLDADRREQALDRLRHLLAERQRADGVWFDSRV